MCVVPLLLTRHPLSSLLSSCVVLLCAVRAQPKLFYIQTGTEKQAQAQQLEWEEEDGTHIVLTFDVWCTARVAGRMGCVNTTCGM